MKSPNVGKNESGQFIQSGCMMLHSEDGAKYHPIMLFIVETWYLVGGYLDQLLII